MADGPLNRRDYCFMIRTVGAKEGSQIKSRFIKLDPRQQQRPSASGTRWPQAANESKCKGIDHGGDHPAPLLAG
jgi:hypothetical protein